MQIYNTTNTENSLIHETWDLCDADITSYPLAKVFRRFNFALETQVGKIINADGTWQYDDTNFTTNPQGVVNLTSATHEYNFNDEFLDIEEVDVLDLGGHFIRLKPWDAGSFDVSFEEYFNITYNGTSYTAPVGFPEYYDKVGDAIKFDKAPTAANTTLTKGLRVRFKRTGSLFTITDTTKEPGIASPWHVTLAKMAALPYCKTYKPDRVPQLERDIATETRDMLDFYSSREKDIRRVMTMKRTPFI